MRTLKGDPNSSSENSVRSPVEFWLVPLKPNTYAPYVVADAGSSFDSHDCFGPARRLPPEGTSRGFREVSWCDAQPLTLALLFVTQRRASVRSDHALSRAQRRVADQRRQQAAQTARPDVGAIAPSRPAFQPAADRDR